MASSTCGSALPKILFVETSEVSVRSHLPEILRRLVDLGYEVVVATRDGGGLAAFASHQRVKAVNVDLAREPSIIVDLAGLLALIRIIWKEKPTLLIYGTPKAGLLTALAGAFMRTPLRIYVLHGLRFETSHGLRRQMLRLTEWVTIRASHTVVCVGPTLKKYVALDLGVESSRLQVLGTGSASGVDIACFRPLDHVERARVRAQLGLHTDDFVFIFVGRVTQDKGVRELLEAFCLSKTLRTKTRLLLVGEMEMLGKEASDYKSQISRADGVTWLPHRSGMADLIGSADCLVLPTYREGLPNVLLEAASAGVPIISTYATGVEDIVTDGETGSLVPVGSVRALGEAMLAVFRDQGSALTMAAVLRARVIERFNLNIVADNWTAMISEHLTPRTAKTVPPALRVMFCSLEPSQPGSAVEAHIHGVLYPLQESVRLCTSAVIDSHRQLGIWRLWQLIYLSLRSAARARSIDVAYMRWHPLGIFVTSVYQLLGKPYILEVNGSLDDIVIAHPGSRWSNKLLTRSTIWQFRHAAQIITVTPGLAHWVRNIARNPHLQVKVLANGAPKSIVRHLVTPQRPSYAAFVGQLAPWQGIETLVAAVESPYWPANLTLKIVGDGELVSVVKDAACSNELIEFLGRLPRAVARKVLAQASVSISPQGSQDGRNRYGVSPIKVSESLLLGVPVALSSLNVSAGTVEALSLGASHAPDDHHDLARAVARAVRIGSRTDQRERISQLAQERYTWEAVAGEVAKMIHAVSTKVPV